MDGQRFDDLVRLMAVGTSRRRVLKGLLGGSLGGALATVGLAGGRRAVLASGGTCADPGFQCATNSDCCQGQCDTTHNICYCSDPSTPWLGCTCTTGTASPCGGQNLLCCATGSTPGGPGVCTSPSTGCNPTGSCAGAGDSCSSDSDCCAGSCDPTQKICYCTDPSRPALGCPCTTGTNNACGDTTLVCCASTTTPGGTGVCTSASVGCNPTGGGNAGDACTTGTQSPCNDGLLCCPTTSTPGGPGVCTPSSTGCSASGNCAGAGDPCTSSTDCCAGQCDPTQKICYCTDLSRPALGCPCTTGTSNPCGDTTLLCCATTSTPGGPGICTSASVGCNVSAAGTAGSACTTGTQNACNTGLTCCPTTSTPGGPGVCTPTSTGCSASGTCAGAGDACTSDSDCCAGSCDPTQKICYCTDPSRPTVGCPCTASNPNTCGGRPDLCCSDGKCASPMVGCNPTGGGNAGDACTTGTQSPCNDGLQCCPTTSTPGGPGVCAPSSQSCPPVLPNTGSGEAGGKGTSWVAPAAVVGAGAALVAARKLWQAEVPSDAGE